MLQNDGNHVPTVDTARALAEELERAANKTIPVRIDMLVRAAETIRYLATVAGEVRGMRDAVEQAEARAESAEDLVADVAAGFNLINGALSRVPVTQNVQLDESGDLPLSKG